MQTVVVTVRDVLRNLLHRRTPENLVLTGKYVVIGCGGVGTWFTLGLALSVHPEKHWIVLVDGDTWEIHNYNRVPLPLMEAFKQAPKAESLAAFLVGLRPYLNITVFNECIESVEKLLHIVLEVFRRDYKDAVIVDCTDNVRTTRLIIEAAKTLGLPYLGMHYDGTHITVEWHPRVSSSELWVTEDGAGGAGYQVFPSFVAAPMMAAALGIALLAQRPQRPVVISLDLMEQQG